MIRSKIRCKLRDSIKLYVAAYFFIYFPSSFLIFWEMDYRLPKSANFKFTINELHLYWMLPGHKHLPRIFHKLSQTNGFDILEHFSSINYNYLLSKSCLDWRGLPNHCVLLLFDDRYVWNTRMRRLSQIKGTGNLFSICCHLGSILLWHHIAT